jgi:ferric-dicitrate binding protein FerR (iron transport regulator)
MSQESKFGPSAPRSPVERTRQAVAVLVTEGRVAVGSEVYGRRSEVRSRKSEVGAGNGGDRNNDDEPPSSDFPSPTSVLGPPSSGRTVDAGHRLVVELAADAASRAAVVPVSAPDVAELLAWRAPRLEFTGAALAEAVALMNRYNRVQFVIEDASLGSLEVSGYFRANNHETFLHLIEQGLGLKSEREGDKILLRKVP